MFDQRRADIAEALDDIDDTVGSPASAKNSATMAHAVAANSEGFHTTVFPAATMWASAIDEMSVGKL